MKKFRHILLSCVLAIGMLNLTVWAQDQSEPPRITAFLEKVGVKLPEEAEISDYSVPVKKSEFVWLVVEGLGKNAYVQKQYLTFSDVKLDDWFHDNVIFGANIGLVSGKGDGSFGTNDLLDENTAGLILMRALGFENLAQLYGIRDTSVAYSGSYGKLFKNVEKDGTVTVGEAYQMVYNMLQSDYVAKEVDGITPSYHIVTDQPYMTAAFDIEKRFGRVTGNQYTQLGLGGSGCRDSYIEIDGVEYKSELENQEEYLGYYVDYFVNNKDKDDPVVLTVIPRSNNEVTVIESNDVEEIERDGKYLVFHYDNGSVRDKTLRVPSTADFVYNGKTANLSENLLNKLIDEQFGTITCVNYDNNWVIRITAYDTMIVETYSDYDEVIVGKNGEKLSVKQEDSKDFRSLEKDGVKASYTDLKKGDVLEYARSLDGGWLSMRICNYTMQGKVTGTVADDEIVIDTISYPLSNYFIKKVQPTFSALGVEQTFLFNTKGEVVDVLADSAIYSGEYVFLLEAKDCTDEEDHLCMIKYVTMNGVILKSFLAEKVQLNGSPKAFAERVINKPLLPVVGGIKQRQLIYIEKNSEGRVRAIYTKDQEGLDSSTYENEILSAGPVEKQRKCKGSSVFLVDTNDSNFPEFYIDEQTKILMVPKSDSSDEVFNDEKNYEVKTSGFFKDAEDYYVEAYNLSEYNVADIMLLRQAQTFDSQHSNNELIVVTGFGQSLNDENEIVETVIGYQKGERVELKVEDEEALYYTHNGVKKKMGNGDIVRFNLNSGGYITHSEYLKNIDSNFNVTTYPEGRNDGNAIAIGYVVSRNANYLKLDFTDEASTRERVFRGTPTGITIYNSKTGKYEKGTMDDLTPDDKVMIRVFYSSLQDVILYR